VFLFQFTFLAMMRNKLQQIESGRSMGSPDTELEQPLMGQVLDATIADDDVDPDL
jgi:hypothetical protein